MTYKPLDVVVIRFPFTDSPRAKKRPALVLSSGVFQEKNKQLTLAMITSAKHSDWHGDVKIKDLHAAGLSTPSIIRQKLFTIDERLVERRAGHLAVIDRKSLLKALAEHLGLGLK